MDLDSASVNDLFIPSQVSERSLIPVCINFTQKRQTANKNLFSNYSQLSPCGHLAITDTPIIRTVAKSPAKIHYRRLTEINSRSITDSRSRPRVLNKGS